MTPVERVIKGANMAARQIIIDAAPGQDDAVGLLMALASPEDVEVLGITLTASRVPLDSAAHNTRRICDLAGRSDIRIFRGCDRPMQRDPVDLQRPEVDITLDGFDGLAEGNPVHDRHAVDFILDTLRSASEAGITLCCFAPLTNLATALEREPELAPRIREIVMMAGSHFEMGNISPVAEANMWLDPEAAQIVLGSGVPCVVMPLDVTHKVVASPARLGAIRAIGSVPAKAAAAWADVVERLYSETFGADGMPLHAPCVIAYMLRPYLFTGRNVNIEVETGSDLTRGMSVVDWWGMTTRPHNALFMSNVDAGGFFALLNERVARL